MKKNKIKYFVLLILIFFNVKVKSNTSQYDEIFNNILNLKFVTSENKINNSDISILQKTYLKNYALFLKTLINQEQQDFNNFIVTSKNNIKFYEKLNDSIPEKDFCIAETKLQLAVNNFIFGYFYKSATDFLSSYYLIKKNNEKFPDFYKNQKLLGIFEMILGNIPSNYDFVKKIFLLKGDIGSGIKKLNNYYNNVKLKSEKTEAKIILYFANKNFNNKIKNIDFDAETKNPLLIFTYANYLVATDSSDKAIKILDNYVDNAEFKFHYINYQKGLLKLYRLDKDAKNDLFLFVNNFNGLNYIKSAYEKIYWWNIIFDNKPENDSIKNLILNKGYEIIDEDKQAVNNISNPYTNIILLKSRLLFDGGYYAKTLKLLLANKNSKLYINLEEKLEYLYRLARTYDKLGKNKKAVELYKKVITFGEDQPYYMAANSALCIAEIYEKQKNFVDAKFFYNKCLSINNYGYKNSIEIKAKAGLNRIKH